MIDHKKRPDCFEFAMDFLGEPEASEVLAYVEKLEACAALAKPKPLSLNEAALQMLGIIERDANYLPEITGTIRRALEQLDD